MPTAELVLEGYTYICDNPKNLSLTDINTFSVKDQRDPRETVLICHKNNQTWKGRRDIGLQLLLLIRELGRKPAIIVPNSVAVGGAGITYDNDDDLMYIENPTLMYEYTVPKNKHLRAFFGTE